MLIPLYGRRDYKYHQPELPSRSPLPLLGVSSSPAQPSDISVVSASSAAALSPAGNMRIRPALSILTPMLIKGELRPVMMGFRVL